VILACSILRIAVCSIAWCIGTIVRLCVLRIGVWPVCVKLWRLGPAQGAAIGVVDHLSEDRMPAHHVGTLVLQDGGARLQAQSLAAFAGVGNRLAIEGHFPQPPLLARRNAEKVSSLNLLAVCWVAEVQTRSEH
jgi:hypothetical protein